MIGYATIGTKDMEKAKAFWSGVLASKGASVL
ncbi:MAG: VOC family protein, partial [Gammaproteobacteria bacterium]|nr:VOC family protein [Gammaproteobacteria bacterium]